MVIAKSMCVCRVFGFCLTGLEIAALDVYLAQFSAQVQN